MGEGRRVSKEFKVIFGYLASLRPVCASEILYLFIHLRRVSIIVLLELVKAGLEVRDPPASASSVLELNTNKRVSSHDTAALRGPRFNPSNHTAHSCL